MSALHITLKNKTLRIEGSAQAVAGLWDLLDAALNAPRGRAARGRITVTVLDAPGARPARRRKRSVR